MERELLSLSMFLVAAVAGAARFRHHKGLDDFSLGISKVSCYAGTLLLVAALVWDGLAAALIPLSLLILLHATALFYKNHFARIFGLPLVIGELLLLLLFRDIREFLASPGFILTALVMHTACLGFGLKLLLHLPRLPMRYGPTWNPYELARKLEEHLPSRLQWKS